MYCSKLKIFFLIFSLFLSVLSCAPKNQTVQNSDPNTLIIAVKSLPSKIKIARLIERKLSRVNERFEMVPDALQSEGFGPFEIIEETPKKIKLKNRHDPALPVSLEFVVFEVIEDDNLRALALKNRQVDVVQNDMWEKLPEPLEESLKQDPHLKFQSTDGSQAVYLAFNLEDPWLSKIEIRKALAYALDPSSFVNYSSTVTPALTLLPPSHWAYEKDVTLYKKEDFKLAQELLKQTLIQDNTSAQNIVDPTRKLTLTLKVASRDMSMARWLAKSLSRLGIELRLDAGHSKQRSQMILMTTPEDPQVLSEPVFLSELYHQTAYDQLSASLSQTSDLPARKEVYSWMQKILSQDLPVIPLWYVKNRIIYRDTIDNVRLRPDGSYEWILDVSKGSE